MAGVMNRSLTSSSVISLLLSTIHPPDKELPVIIGYQKLASKSAFYSDGENDRYREKIVGIAPIALIDAPIRGMGNPRLVQLASIVSSGMNFLFPPKSGTTKNGGKR
jgi:hypothetical protein